MTRTCAAWRVAYLVGLSFTTTIVGCGSSFSDANGDAGGASQADGGAVLKAPDRRAFRWRLAVESCKFLQSILIGPTKTAALTCNSYAYCTSYKTAEYYGQTLPAGDRRQDRHGTIARSYTLRSDGLPTTVQKFGDNGYGFLFFRSSFLSSVSA